jgi:hypothetical protein
VEPCDEVAKLIDKNLKAVLYWLGKFIDDNNVPEKEWCTFSINFMIKEKGTIGFVSPSITLGIANTDEVKKEDDIVIINEFNYRAITR